MSASFHKREPLDRLAPGSVVEDKRRVQALKLGPDHWVACIPGGFLQPPYGIMSVPITTESLRLPVRLCVAPKEVTS